MVNCPVHGQAFISDLFDAVHLQVDEDIVKEVVNLGFDRTLLIESLQNRVQNQVYWFRLLISDRTSSAPY